MQRRSFLGLLAGFSVLPFAKLVEIQQPRIVVQMDDEIFIMDQVFTKGPLMPLSKATKIKGRVKVPAVYKWLIR